MESVKHITRRKTRTGGDSCPNVPDECVPIFRQREMACQGARLRRGRRSGDPGKAGGEGGDVAGGAGAGLSAGSSRHSGEASGIVQQGSGSFDQLRGSEFALRDDDRGAVARERLRIAELVVVGGAACRRR